MKKTLFLFLILVTSSLISQTKQEKVTEDFIAKNPYFNSYQEELFFLHTNKTVYFSGEKIWFAAYVLNKSDEKPSTITKNLHVNLYDTNFKLIEQKLYYVKDGKATGQFKLLENLISGNYYLELDTNWNRNFKKGTITKIEIVNLINQQDQKSTNATPKMLLQKANVKIKQTFLISRVLKNNNSATFKIRTTRNTIKKHQGNTLFAVLHKNGVLRSCAPIDIDKKNNYNIKFDSDFFLNGANTITLFDDKNTILAEKSFWNFDTELGKVAVDRKVKKGDSLYVYLKLPENISQPNLSVSILNAETKMISNHNIKNSFIDIDYATIKKLKENNEVDNFIANRTTHKLNKTSSLLLYNNEIGVKVKGSVNTDIKNSNGYKITLSSKENELLLVSDLKKDMSFEFNNLFLKHPTDYKLSLSDKEKKNGKADFYLYDLFYNYKTDSILKTNNILFNKESKKSNLSKENILFKLDDGAIELDEVVVTSYIDKQKKMRKKHQNIIGVQFSNFHIPDENLAAGTDIFYYLYNVPGVLVKYDPLTNIPYVYNDRGPKTITGNQLMNVKLNGVPLNGDLSPLIGLLTSDVEVIVVNLSGAGEGLRGTNGVIDIILKRGGSFSSKNKFSRIRKRQTTKGFETSLNKYVKSNLIFSNNDWVKSYGTIDWIPIVKEDSNKQILLKIPISKKHKNIKLIINGFDKNGVLIHENISISN
jgi:hypothetical protein